MSWRHKALDRRKWARIRLRVLDGSEWRCASCGHYANEVDHIRPLHKGRVDPYDEMNLQALCGGPGGCHAAKTRLENRRPRSRDELEWDRYVQEVANG